ncbi:MAG: ATP-binding protein [bacterium]
MALRKNKHKLTAFIMIIPLLVLGIMLFLFMHRIKNMGEAIHLQLEEIKQNKRTIDSSDQGNVSCSHIDKQIAHTYNFLSVSFLILSLGMILLILILIPIFYRIMLRPLFKIDNKIKNLFDTDDDSSEHKKYPVARLEKSFNALFRQFQTESMKRRELEKELDKARKQIDQIYSISGEGIRIIDKDFNIISLNKTFADIAGTDYSECINKKCYDIFGSSSCNTPDCHLKKLFSGETKMIEVETERIREDGTKAICILKASCIYDENNQPVGMAESFKDITDLKYSQKTLNKLYEEIKEKNKQLEDFVYITTHDLRSPLINLKGFVAELEENIKDLGKIFNKIRLSKEIREEIYTLYWEDMPECIHFINSATSKMENLVNSLLKLFHLKQNKIHIKALDMNQIILQVKASFGAEIKNSKTKIKVGDLPVAYGDEDQINQVFSNLVGNALHYLHPRRPGVISITGKQMNKRVIFCVEDNGIGINKKYHEKIFQVFQRLEPDVCPGEGVGLSIVHNILEKHGGQIWVESEENKGSKFFVSLPSN